MFDVIAIRWKAFNFKGRGHLGAKGGKFYRGFDFIPATLYSLNCVRVIDSKTGLNIECACPSFACNRFYPKLRYRIFKLCAPVIVPGIVQVLPVYRSSLKFRRVFVSTRNLTQTWVWLNSSWIWYFTQRSCNGVTRNNSLNIIKSSNINKELYLKYYLEGWGNINYVISITWYFLWVFYLYY